MNLLRFCFLILSVGISANGQNLPAGVQGPTMSTATQEILYSFPDIHNPNPIGGRLYLQPIGPHPDKVVMNTMVGLQFSTSSEYNSSFAGHSDTQNALHSNSSALNFRLSHGFKIKGAKLEVGGVVRSYWDNEKTALSVFLAEYHDTFKFYKSIPPKGTPLKGSVGDKHTVLIAENGEMYITTAEAYVKLQIYEEKEGSYLPNIALSFHAKIPTTDLPYDKPGAGVSLGLSKHITDRLIAITALSVACQDLQPADFSASNININPCNGDAFVGAVYDMGSPGGWYTSMGVTIQQNRVHYPENPLKRMWVGSGQLALFYQSESKNWEWYASLGEGAFNHKGSPYPDLIVLTGLNFRFDSTRIFDNEKQEE